MQLERDVDYITIYDGVSEKSPIICSLTGILNETNISSATRSMFIIYYKKNINEDEGFSAEIVFGKY